MKSSQERSNECLPPKKREIPVTSLPSEEKTAAPASESQRVDSVRWSPSISSSQSSAGLRHSNTATLVETDLQQGIVLHKSLSTAADYSSPSAPRSTSAMQSSAYPPALTQSGATLSPAHYTHLQHPFQFAQYGAPFAAIVPSQLVSPTANSTSGAVTSTSSASATATTPSQRSQLEAYSTMLTSMGNITQQSHKVEQHLCRPPGLVTAGSPTATSPAPQNQFVRVSSSPLSVSRTVSSPASQLHPHSAVIPHNLTSQVVLQYADSGSHCYTREGHKKAEDSRLQVKEILNGEIEKSRRYGISPSAGTNLKTGNKAASHHYEARHLVVHPSPSDYSAHNSSGVRTSVMVVPNSNSFAADLEVHHAIKRDTSPSAVHEKVGINLGKVGSRPYALSPQQTLGHEGVKTIANLSPHTVIHTTHNASEHLPVGLSPTAFYTSTQHPVIGYLSSQQSAVGYHGNLSHLVIPGAQPFLIPLSSADVEASGVASAIVTSSPHYAAVPHTFVSTAIPKTENFSHEAVTTQPAYQAAVLQAQIHLPVAQPASSPTAASPALPPYFMKGSIIQLANGELKKVEDLKTEDFIQSAEISNELKIDSSTVERIEESHNPGFAVIQFAVGEHRTQVVVEVVIEYPFFVFGQGWSSCCPERTSQLFDLPCCKLSVGDVCISLTLKNLKNGSVKKGQPMDSAGVLLKHPKNDGLSGYRSKYVEQDNGIKQGNTEIVSENGELKFPEKTLLSSGSLVSKTEFRKPTATRKRRWSAPETRRVEKTEEEPPLTLPKPSFIPQEVKICIEGRSNVGK